MTADITYKMIMPCNLSDQLNPQHEYTIIDCEPKIPLGNYDDIKRLNDILEDINCENPNMTTKYLSMLLKASHGLRLFDEEFIRKAIANDFLFEDISHISWRMDAKEKAACYLATELIIPFEKDMSNDIFKALSSDEMVDYIDWKSVWRKYEMHGFTLISSESGRELFIIYWK